jgi:cobalt/nickel transport system permease protein
VTNLFIERSVKSALNFFKEAIFSDDIARSKGLLQALDPRLKIILLAFFLVAALLVRTLAAMTAFYSLGVLLALLSGIRLAVFLKRTWCFIPFFALLIAIPAFFTQGPYTAILFITRVATCVSFAVLFTVTTRHAELIRALRSLGVPAIFVSVLDMTYRYIFLFVKIFEDMHLGLKARLVRSLGGAEARQWVASRMGHLFRRSVRMSEEVYLAMVARGYTMEPKRDGR